MPRNGSIVLTDLPFPKLRLHCGRCDLRRQYDVQALIDKVGNAMVTHLLDHVAKHENCPARPLASIYDQCKLRIGWPGDPPLR